MDESIKPHYYGNPREEMLTFVPPSARRVLEVGCGRGAFASRIKMRTGVTVWGIELDREAAQIAAGHLDKVINQDATSALAGLGDERFDCIVFNDVLEHLVDPYLLLAEARRHLATGGVVVASIPNIRHTSVLADLVLRGNFDYADWGILDRTHLRFFTKNSIGKMFEALGYSVEISGLPPPPTPWGWVADILLPKRFKDIRFIQFACVARPSA